MVARAESTLNGGAAMEVMTVLGPVAREELGIVLPHEHLFIDLRNQFTEPADPQKAEAARQPLCMENLGLVRINPYAIRDNLLLDDVAVAIREVEWFRQQGGRTLVDCTSIGIQRDVRKLRQVAEQTGAHIVAGCGYYTADTHPREMDDWRPEAIADRMLRDMLEGVDGTSIRAGIYGEIGTSAELHPNEVKCLAAVGLAFRSHRAAVQVHTYPWARGGLEAARLLADCDVDPSKVVICHIDVQFDRNYLLQLLKLGVNIEFDNFGKEFFIPKEDRGFAGGVFARDIERVHVLLDLLEAGYERQLLITNDVCLKCMLRTYGGLGYEHLLRNVVPMMRDRGIPATAIERLLRDNPARVLCN
jgi:phosphotriesterase-related protein